MALGGGDISSIVFGIYALIVTALFGVLLVLYLKLRKVRKFLFFCQLQVFHRSREFESCLHG
jgi:hypothetical protein